MNAATADEPFVFSPPSTPVDAGSVDHARDEIEQARREITFILREVAAAAGEDRTRDGYVRFFADRVLRAMAAHGVIVWRHAGDDRYEVEHRLGESTDAGFSKPQFQTHARMLAEIAAGGQPVVVPPTPGADQADVPANPSAFPAAVVCVRLDARSPCPEVLLEVFLEGGGTPASQRGSLRFLAQMADLAGEFMRQDQLRSQRERLEQIEQVDQQLRRLHWMTRTHAIAAAWVDAIADCVDVPRVSLCRIDGGRSRLIAVSNVDRIDRHGDAARRIINASMLKLARHDGCLIARCDDSGTVDSRESISEKIDEQTVEPEWVVATAAHSPWRIVLSNRTTRPDDSRSTNSIENKSLRPSQLASLRRLMIGGQQAIDAAARIESIPGARWWMRWNEPAALGGESGGDGSGGGGSGGDGSGGGDAIDAGSSIPTTTIGRKRTWLVRGLIAAALVGVGVLPVPAIVPATGVIRPAELDGYHAPLDAVVDEILVDHGQSVTAGQVLATMTSRDLQQRRSTLLGRRSVLTQQRQRFNQSMATARDPLASAQTGPGREIDEEITAIDNQLGIIDAATADLTLRARRGGRVDAWRVRETLVGRPLRQGDRVCEIIVEGSPWVVDARVPTRRVARLRQSMIDSSVSASVLPQWSPDQSIHAMAQSFGPVTRDPVDQTSTATLRLLLEWNPDADGSSPRHGLAESPAKVAIRCGQTTLGRFLVEDLATWCDRQIRMLR